MPAGFSIPQAMTIARALREMASYESREMRIGALRDSRYLDVRLLAAQLTDLGLMKDNSFSEIIDRLPGSAR